MHRISRDHIAYSIDKTHPPILEINPGERVTLETYDARTGTIQRDTDLLDHPHPDGANPATGPIYVRGAEPGDAPTDFSYRQRAGQRFRFFAGARIPASSPSAAQRRIASASS